MMERPTVSNDTEHPPGDEPEAASAGGIYDYVLGGDAYTEADKIAAVKLRQVMPEIHDGAWENRGFLGRAVRTVAELDIAQFIDVGSGLPTEDNTHQIAQRVTPDATVIYVDNDPKILRRAQEHLVGTARVHYITGDILEPPSILAAPAVRDNIDFNQPVALVLAAVLHFVADPANPWLLVRQYMDALPSGSYLILSHGTADEQIPEKARKLIQIYNSSGKANAHLRGRADVERFFEGLELLPPYAGAEPGIVSASQWGAEDPSRGDPSGSWLYCGVARKP
jgi:hypothetical protein